MNTEPTSTPTLPKRLSLVAQSVNSLREGIASGHWRQHLPGERELCEALQISRRTLPSRRNAVPDDGQAYGLFFGLVEDATQRLPDSRAHAFAG